MTLNIYTQLCGLVICIIILLFYTMQRKMNIKKERHYLRCNIVVIVLLVLDIAATVLNTYDPEGWITTYVNRAYLIATMCSVSSMVLYICGEVFSNKTYKYIFYGITGFGMVLALVVAHTGLTTNDVISAGNGKIVYTEGSACVITYSLGFAGIVSIMILSLIYEKKLGRKQAVAIRVWMGIWTVFALIQYFTKFLLICSFAIALGLLIMYISLGAFDTAIDHETGLFTWDAYLQYVAEQKRDKKKVSVIYLKSLPSVKVIDEKIISLALAQFDEFVLKRKDIFTFRLDREYIIVLRDLEVKTWLDEYKKMASKYPIISTYYFPIYMEDSTILESQSELPSLVSVASKDINTNDTGYIVITLDVLNTYNDRNTIETLIEHAIKENRVVVFFQPIFGIHQQKFMTAEALVRIIRTDGTIVPPGIFIPIAEKNGMINRLDEIVFERVCRFIASNDMASLGLEYIEVNLSVAQLCNERLADKYLSIMETYNVLPQYINLEITESAELDRGATFKNNLAKFMEHGIHFSLDDYGTGYSNLSYVLDMPVEIVKFDKQIIDAYFKDDKAKCLMEHSIQMFKTLKFKIVSEGIETKIQLDEMKRLGIDYIQGYYFSKPIPEDEFIAFLKEKN